jgi:1-acyl-sn-glycerol-3-phosphate acyltransferase
MEDDRFVLRSVTDEIMYELMLLSRQEYVDMYATSMKDRLLAAARAKAKELQQDAADTIEKIDKGIKGDGATSAHDEPLVHDDEGGSSGSAPDGSAPDGSAPDGAASEHAASDDAASGEEGRPPTSQGDERAAS